MTETFVSYHREPNFIEVEAIPFQTGAVVVSVESAGAGAVAADTSSFSHGFRRRGFSVARS